MNYAFTMDPLITDCYHYRESTINHYLFREFIMNPFIICELTIKWRFFWRIQYWFIIFFAISLIVLLYGFKFTICFANSISVHCLFRDYTENSLFVREYTMNSRFIPRIHYGIIFLRIQFEFRWFFAYILWIHYLSRE